MQLLLEFLPLVAFVVAYLYFGGIYVATAVLMGGMLISLLVFWLRQGQVPKMFGISTALVVVLGAVTLLLRDVRFIQWKPTIFLWLLGVAFLVSAFVGRQPLAQRMMQPTLGDAQLERRDWLKLNAAWVLYGLVMGAANILVAYNAAESTWVTFKFAGLMASMFLFLIGQMAWLQLSGKLKA